MVGKMWRTNEMCIKYHLLFSNYPLSLPSCSATPNLQNTTFYAHGKLKRGHVTLYVIIIYVIKAPSTNSKSCHE